MKIQLLQIDKTQEPYLAEGIEGYTRRLGNYSRFEIHTITVPKTLRQRSIPEQKEAEGKLILKELTEGDHLVLLDEKGKQMSSTEFSRFIAQKQSSGLKRVVFLIGGPYGFSEEIYNRADSSLESSNVHAQPSVCSHRVRVCHHARESTVDIERVLYPLYRSASGSRYRPGNRPSLGGVARSKLASGREPTFQLMVKYKSALSRIIQRVALVW